LKKKNVNCSTEWWW